MTIEEKAKAYDEALERASKLRVQNPFDTVSQMMEHVFPELKESEDERIRKAIVEMILDTPNVECEENYNVRKEDALAWLEKQSQVKETSISQHDNKTCKKTDNSLTCEDEKIRKALIEYFNEQCDMSDWNGVYGYQVVAWLEKQGINNTNKECNGWELEWIEIFRNANEQYQMSQNSAMSKDAAELTIKGLKRLYLYDIVKEYILDEYQDKEKVSTDIVKDKNVHTPIVFNEPKFKVGDFIVNDYCFGKVIEITNDAYVLDTEQRIPFSYEHNAHLWSIADAKPGDVLCYKDEISLYKHDIKDWSETSFGGFVYHCCYDGKRFITDSFYSLTEQDKTDIHPATKEQRDLLFEKMKDAGYEWDAEEKELRKIE